MHLLDTTAVFVVLVMVGVEFSVSAFVNPSAWRLEPDSQATMLSHYAAVLGKAMPVWYAASFVLLAIETWLHRQTPGFVILLTASSIWLLVVLATIFFLVPLNNRVIKSAAGWQAAHRAWDRRHRLRIAALAVASILFTYVVVG